MELDVIVLGVKAEVVGSDCITVLFDKPWKTVSTAIYKGGYYRRKSCHKHAYN